MIMMMMRGRCGGEHMCEEYDMIIEDEQVGVLTADWLELRRCTLFQNIHCMHACIAHGKLCGYHALRSGPLGLCASRLSTRHRNLLQINCNLKQPAENDDRIFTIRSEAFALINYSFTYRTLHKVIWHLLLECAKVNIVWDERHTQLHRSTAMSSRAPASMVVLHGNDRS